MEPARTEGLAIHRLRHLIRKFEERVAECDADGRGGARSLRLMRVKVKLPTLGLRMREAPASGRLAEILGQVRGVDPIGEVLAVIDTPGGG